MQAEVRLYYLGRTDYDTQHFTAVCPTDILNQATAIAKKQKADHYNFGVATAEEEYQHRGPVRRAPKGLGASAKEQVEAIKGFLGVNEEQ